MLPMRPWFVVNKPSVQANLTGLEGVIGTIGIVLQRFTKKNFKSRKRQHGRSNCFAARNTITSWRHVRYAIDTQARGPR